jgi:DNA-binding CsgD family transcriptional regulator
VLVFYGPPGIGKSSLVRAAAQEARARGLCVLAARGGELERDAAFGVVRQLFTPPLNRSEEESRRRLLFGPAARTVPMLGLASSRDPGVVDTYAALHGLHSLLLNLAAERPVLLAVDDLQWADPFSQQAIEYLSRRVEGERVAIVAGVRMPDPGAQAVPVAAILGDSRVSTFELGPLSPKGSDRLLSAALGVSCDPAFLNACRGVAHGNPYLILEVARACVAEDVPLTEEGARRVHELGPASVARSVLVRVAARGDEAASLVRALAVLESAPTGLAADVAGLDARAASQAADALVDANVLEPERPLHFVHPIVRNAILSELAVGEAARLHRRAAERISECDGPSELIAAHLQRTEPMADPWVVKTLRVAARAAVAGGAAQAAVGYLERARAEPAPEAEQGALLAELGYARLVMGDLAAGLDELREALGLLDPTERAVILAFGALYMPVLDAGVAEALDSLGDSSIDVRMTLESHRRFDESFGAHLGRLRTYRDLPGAREGERAMLCALVASEAYTAAASADDVSERAVRGLAGSTFAVDAQRFPAGAVFEFDTPRWAWEALVMAGRPELVLEQLDAAMEIALRIGAPILVASLHRERAEALARNGELESACTEWRSALDALAAAPEPMMMDDPVRLWLAWALAEQGKRAESRVLIDATSIVTMENVFFLESRHIRGAALARLGDPEAAVADLLAGGEALERFEIRNPAYELPWRAEAATALAALGRTAEARDVITPAVEHARRWNAPGPLGRTLHAQAIVTHDPDERLAGLRDATDALRSSVQRLDLARVLVDYGSALRRAGQRVNASELLLEGADLADRCAAMPLVARAREELAATGRRPRRARISGPESLTPSELRVATRAAAERTNAQICQELFLSPKTVEMHLSRAYRKLEINGRGELAAALKPQPQP